MLKSLVILGAGGFARETLDVVDAINAIQPTYEFKGFIVDAQYKQPGAIINDYPVLGDFDWIAENEQVYTICGVGAPELRLRLVQKAKAAGAKFCNLIHPNAILTRWVKLGTGVVITAGCILTNQITIGEHVHINLDCTVGHDVVIEDFVTLAPGVHISGNVTLQEGCYIGTGANIIEKKLVGRWSIVGAGSTVVKDVPSNTTLVGNPGKVIKERSEGWHLA